MPLATSIARAEKALARYDAALDRVMVAAERLATATAKREAMEAAYLVKWGRPFDRG